jgi:hypothetical protein
MKTIKWLLTVLGFAIGVGVLLLVWDTRKSLDGLVKSINTRYDSVTLVTK